MVNLLALPRRFPDFFPSGPADTGNELIPQNKSTPILLLISEPQLRNDLRSLLVENNYYPLLLSNQEELLRVLKANQFAIVLIDCKAVYLYDVRIISKIKVVCKHGRIIIFCNKAHLCDSQHRDLIKDILTIGVYACILAPFSDWEVLSMITYYSRFAKM
jgi:response regulator RpfG family c-di-GMP phosphodiesterase